MSICCDYGRKFEFDAWLYFIEYLFDARFLVQREYGCKFMLMLLQRISVSCVGDIERGS